jgi:hypothetical protein
MASISIREFARRDGCDEKLVRRAITNGRLRKSGVGVDESFVGSDWRPRKSADINAVSAKDGETPAQAAERLALTLFEMFPTKADAERVKETYLALLRKLEFDKERGTVALLPDVFQEVSADYSRVRSRLLPMGAQLAGKLATIKSPAEIQAVIDQYIAEALKELSYDGRLRAEG